jgi:hypothetical protein
MRRLAVIENNDKKVGGRRDDEGAKQTGKGVTRPGLPARSSVLSERTFISPGKKRYRIIRTSERDPYDEPDPADEKTRR